MQALSRLFTLVLALVLAQPVLAKQPSPVILISLDGFRADYLDRGITPNLSRLAASGQRAAMRPSFPSKTFPNHWTLVTGLRPDEHGITANRIEDPARPGEVFTMASDDPFWWNAAPPIWVGAEKAGIRTATMFWPGSNVGWGGVRERKNGPVKDATRPQDWVQYNEEVSTEQRVNTVLDWLRRPRAIRPQLVTTYFEGVDTAGHTFGPEDPRTNEAIAEVDKAIGALLSGVKALGLQVNLVIVADHGMSAISPERIVPADSLADPALYRLIENGSFASFVPTPGNEEKLAAALLRPREHVECWRRDQIPERLHYGRNPRVTPFLCLAEPGWMIPATKDTASKDGGAHGFDNAAPDMAALFLAAGPAFRKGGRLPPFDNIAVEPLLRHLLRMPLRPGSEQVLTPFKESFAK